jgi:hypothetical protein
LDDLVQRGYDTNFNVDVVSCRFTGFNRDGKYTKNHAKHHRIAIFTADDKNAKINDKNLFALIASPRGRITPQMSNVTNQNLKV